jgi:hypothetical protein
VDKSYYVKLITDDDVYHRGRILVEDYNYLLDFRNDKSSALLHKEDKTIILSRYRIKEWISVEEY